MALDLIKHKNIMLKILKDIYTDGSLGPLLGFKGGTALYLFYSLNRFSVDLDFDLLQKTKEQQVFDKIEEIIGEYGFIKEKTKKRYTLFFLLSYSEEAQNIKVEINKRFFGSLYEVKNYLGISMLVMKSEDMFAHKLVALTERDKIANRDIYDIHFFLKSGWKINKEIVEQRTKMSFSDYLRKCIVLIEKIPGQGILSGIGELINEKQKFWVKANLKQDTIFLLNLMLDNEQSKYLS